MAFKRMEIEAWFDSYQFEREYDIGESGVMFTSLNELDIDLGDFPLRYGHHRGAPELREQIALDYPGVGVEQIAVTNGASEAIFAVVASLVGPGDLVIVEYPNFPSLYEVPFSLEREVKYYRLAFERGFKLDVDELERHIEPHTKLIMLTQPNNPTGSLMSENDLVRLIEIVEKHGIYLLMDETYRELSFGKPLPPAAVLSPRAISITSMSKSYRVPGIRIGWVVADEAIIESIRAVREQVTICNSTLGERIAHSILLRKTHYLAETRELVSRNLEVLTQWMEARDNLEWVPPSGGVVVFPRMVGVDSSEAMCRLLIEKYRTFVVPGYCFGMPNHLRVGFGGDTENLMKGLDYLDRALDEV